MPFSLSKLKENPTLSLLLAAFGLLLIVLALWIPFGLSTGDFQEQWHIRTLVALEYNDFHADLGELALTRPMARILFWIAYYISPENFVGDNLLLISLLWLKGLALMALVLRLFPKRYLLAFLLAAVTILYPIDTGVVSLRIPHIHFGITAYLFSLYSLLSYWQTNQARYLYIFAVLLTLCGFAYELFYPLIALSPFLLLFYEKRVSKRLIKLSIAWYIPSVVTLLYSAFMIFVLRFGFQQTSVQTGLPTSRFLERIMLPYSNTLISMWNPAALRLDSQWLPFTLIIASIFFGIACFIYFLNRKTEKTLSWKEWFCSLLIAFLAIGLGFLVLVPTNRAEYQENYRIFLTSSVGAAAFFTILLYQIAGLSLGRLGQLILNFVFSIFIVLSINFHLNIHQAYVESSHRQARFYQQIIETLPIFPEAKTLIIMPDTEQLEYDFDVPLKPHIFSAALQYLYNTGDIIDFALVCNDGQIRCDIRNGEIVARMGDGPLRIPADSLILYQINREGHLELLSSYPELPTYQLDLATVSFAPIPQRFQTIFGYHPEARHP